MSGHATVCALQYAELIRQRRQEVFPKHLFSDPAWDMLVQLYAAAKTERQVLLIDLCGGHVPTSVVSRWVDVLQREKLIVVDADGGNSVTLTTSAHKRMQSLFEPALGHRRQVITRMERSHRR